MHITIEGRNGSGKTTLAKKIVKMLKAEGAYVELFDGVPEQQRRGISGDTVKEPTVVIVVKGE